MICVFLYTFVSFLLLTIKETVSLSRTKTIMERTCDLNVDKVLNSYDTMCEILLLLPPKTVYKLILVSKRWLQVISSTPSFRYTYIAKWKPTFRLIGFFSCNTTYLEKGPRIRRPPYEPALRLLSTSVIGNEIVSSQTLDKLGYYIDSSNGFLLSGRHPKDYFLWDPNTRNHHKIPRPRIHFKELCMSLITEDCPTKGFSYKVIRAECCLDHSTKVRIETYFSKTRTWSYSELTCPEPIYLTRWTPGRVIQGIVYWHTNIERIAIYNSNDEEKQINVIELPETLNYQEQVLGESEDGCLLYGYSNKYIMEIWKLEKSNNDVLQWNFQYKVNFKIMWRNNVEATKMNTTKRKTQLLAFVHQKSGCVYIKCHLFVFMYDPETGSVAAVPYRGRTTSSLSDFCQAFPYFQPFWPSSPSSLEVTKSQDLNF